VTKTLVVLEKEWLELRLQRSLLVATLALPPAITFFALAVFYVAGFAPDLGRGCGLPLTPDLVGMSTTELAQAIVGRQFSVAFLLVPVFIPSVIASYAIVGEKRDRTLEPVLATPVRTWELLLGKTMAAILPAIVVTGICAALFILGVNASAISTRVAHAVVSSGWLAVLVLDMPLLTLIGVALIVIVSSRVNDPRTAQQISAVLIVPVLGLLFGQLTGVLVLSPLVAIVAGVVLALIAAATFRLAARLFQREQILTRWR